MQSTKASEGGGGAQNCSKLTTPQGMLTSVTPKRVNPKRVNPKFGFTLFGFTLLGVSDMQLMQLASVMLPQHQPMTWLQSMFANGVVDSFTANLQAAASAAELQKEKIDVGGLQNSMFGGGTSRFGCLERPGAGFSSIYVDFH